jgi:hypothetical protein
MKNLIVSILTVSSLVTLASPALADHNRHRDDQNCYIRYERTNHGERRVEECYNNDSDKITKPMTL